MGRKGIFIPPEKEGEVGLFIHPIDHDFRVNDEVIDLTAEQNGWPDLGGRVMDVDGSHVLVKYESGAVRPKMHINLRKVTPERG
jgi:hypothetical protein